MHDEADSPSQLQDLLAGGMLEELREAQRERWRAEVRAQSALDHLRFYDGKNQLLESQVVELTTRGQALDEQIAKLTADLQGVAQSRAWRMVLRLRRVKAALQPWRR